MRLDGDAENARHEIAGHEMRHQNARVENARHEIAGHEMRHQNARVENARHENARNAKVWNTACCICLSIAEQECISAVFVFVC